MEVESKDLCSCQGGETQGFASSLLLSVGKKELPQTLS